MKKLLVLCLLFASLFVAAQKTSRLTHRPMDAWVISSSGNVDRGILHSVNDTGIVLSGRYSENTVNYSYKNIDRIQLRRKNSVLKGTLIGAGAGLAIGIIAGYQISTALNTEESDAWGLLIGTYIAGSSGLVLSGIGALAGLPKITIPVQGSKDSYIANLSRLNAWSQNSDILISTQTPRFEHRSFIGFMAGPAFKIGSMETINYNGKDYTLRQGYLSGLTIGYMMREPWGIAVTLFGNQFNTSDKDYWFLMQGLAIGPLYSIPMGSKFRLDLKPQVAFMATDLVKEEYTQTEITGIGIKANVGIRYNIAHRLSLLADLTLLSSGAALPGTNLTSASTFNLNFGLAYRYR
jgi:hypothetical protein